MTDLLTLKESVQQVANAISTVFKVDVEVINLDYVRVAGTGKYAKNIGEKINHNHVYQKVIENKLEVLIDNPQRHPFCLPCPNKNNCLECAELCAPIFSNDSPIGVFGLVAFTEDQRKLLIDYQSELMSFIKQMGQMIAAKVKENEYVQRLLVAREQLEAIINSVKEGIIAVNSSGIVSHCNKSGAILLAMDLEKIINHHLDEVLPGSPMLEVLTTGVGYENQEIRYPDLNKFFLSTARPVTSNGKIIEVVCSFRAIEEVKQLILDYTEKKFHVSISTIIGKSKGIEDLKQNVVKFAGSRSTIMIRGESGTGKELIARAIHSASPRHNNPFIAINCSAIPDALLESELFGYEEGAFTGAKRLGKPGKFEMADKGTIFLDEIGDMPLHLQVKILRTLQEKTIERVGGNSSIKIDVRIIAATNRPLEDMITQGEFREDLYYRLNVIPLHIPSLRQRKEDIPLLLEHFTHKYNNLFNKSIKGFSKQAIDTIMAYDWPGNVRELENAVEYAFNISLSPIILEESLPGRLRVQYKQQTISQLKTLADIERTAILNALKQTGITVEGKKQAAEALGIGIATLYRKIKDYKIL